MKLSDYEELPDILSTEELNKLFRDALEMYHQQAYGQGELLEILFELANRQYQ